MGLGLIGVVLHIDPLAHLQRLTQHALIMQLLPTSGCSLQPAPGTVEGHPQPALMLRHPVAHSASCRLREMT